MRTDDGDALLEQPMSDVAQRSPLVAAAPSSASGLRTILWWLMLLACAWVSFYATRYLITTPGDEHFSRYIIPLRLHIAGGIGALLAGPWQFSNKLRRRSLNLHRWLGRFYLIEIVLGAAGGLLMATVSEEGMATHLGFGILAVLWIVTGWQAYRTIRRGQVSAHRDWMTRNFALTLAAVTLRIYLPVLLFGLHWSFRQTYITVAWLCWIPNLLVAEWLIRRRTL